MKKLLVLYINLDDRTDRLAQITEELKLLDDFPCQIQRVSAIKHKNGALGCSKSHRLAAEIFYKSDCDVVMVLEDDFCFTVNRKVLHEKLLKSMEKLSTTDVVLLSCYNGCKDVVHLSKLEDGFIRVKNMTGAMGYMYNKSYIPKILTIMDKSIKLLENGNKESVGALDIVWRMCQTDDKWLLLIPDVGRQRSSYSDIRNVVCNYKETYSELYLKYN